jgi:putative RNA 2'-phosphotransferase
MGSQAGTADARRRRKLGKFLALILCHQPERFALAVDEQGWAQLPEVLEILAGLPNFRWAKRADVMLVVGDESEAGERRFEVAGDRIRALYGHSFSQPIVHAPCAPPSTLYYGTSDKAVEAIHHRGLFPMGHQYVRLWLDSETAEQAAGRYSESPVVVIVQADEAYASGITFFRAGERVYLANYIPPEFLGIPRNRDT